MEVLSSISTNTRPKSKGNFIEANTLEINLQEIRDKHIIPVFSKDNNPAISHDQFIQCVEDVVLDEFSGHIVATPNIRVSHPIKGRIPDARHKKASELEDWEKTLYYERMAFMIEIVDVFDEVNGNFLNLTIGGIKSYHLDNLNSKKGSIEHFQLFIGFKNNVCTNLCVWTDGLQTEVKATNVNTIQKQLRELIFNFKHNEYLVLLKKMGNYSLSESQFAHILGRCRLYHYLPEKPEHIQPFLFTDSQVNKVAKNYFEDEHFSHQKNQVSLWDVYNLLTDANKSSYINTFLPRGNNAFAFTQSLVSHLDNHKVSWFLS